MNMKQPIAGAINNNPLLAVLFLCNCCPPSLF